MTAADYRAEARAWRRRAELCDAGCIPNPMSTGMAGRWLRSMVDGDRPASLGEFASFWLLLALEAEDDARRAEP